MSHIASELRRLRKENVRLNRRQAMMELSGVVAERDAKTRKVRLDLGAGEGDEGKVLSPWVRVQSGSAGKFKSFVLPSVGEQMTLHSASGVIGADSVARYGCFTDENPHPEQDADEAVLFENGKSRIAVKDGRLVMKVGESTTTVTDGKVETKIAGSIVTHTAQALTTKVDQVTTTATKVRLVGALETTGSTDLSTGSVA